MTKPKHRWLRFAPSTMSKAFATGFEDFVAGCGVKGLAAIKGKALLVLAVQSTKPGTGQFREFIRLATKDFAQVLFLHVGNEFLQKKLVDYGFRRCRITLHNEVIEAMERRAK